MLYFKKHGKGLKCTLLLQWIICAVLWSLSIAPLQAAGALWQNPYTGRIISLPLDVNVEWNGIDGDLIVLDDYKNDIRIYLTKGDESFYNDDPASDNSIDFKPNGTIAGHPIQSYNSPTAPCEFHMDVSGQIWGVRLSDCAKRAKYSQLRALFDVILPSMIPLKSDEAFELTIPWSEQKIKLSQTGHNKGDWNAYATSLRVGLKTSISEPFFIKTSKHSKNYDGLLVIYGDDVEILGSSRQVTPENLDAQLTASTLQKVDGSSIVAYKNVTVAGRSVLKGQYMVKGFCCPHLDTYYLIPLKNRIWTVVSSVYEDEGHYPNAAQRINIIEQIIATLPDNPPDIVTTYTNPQTKKQLKLPKGWGVMQDFPDGLPKDMGIVELDKAEDAATISYSCGPQFVSMLKYLKEDNDHYRKARFANRDVFIRDDLSFDLYTKDKAGACHLEITNYDKNIDKDKLIIAEKLFATENP
ncbi:hypothetical protein N5853_08880 [Bartonella sp. HY329]|uniref:hypothetical protein n=1 Tax=unclassified Bartonella TaxID=2645622 RepID=UPI0021C7CB4B|nr:MULTISPECIES: hypothetical protein [unclassified Bartonella]UXM94225.1 hypothetical protein N5853_08880 [Bartonella sp. HY329]UXN08548.1 hypothetical protein N5852_08890 [Bartonella sp. HY328]